MDFYSGLRSLPADRGDAVLRFASLNGAGTRAVGTYSGGMLQRLGLAVAMLPESGALLLDEPTAALDPEGLCSFYGLVERRRAEGRTVLFTSHQVGDVERIADRFLVLVRGRQDLRTIFGRQVRDGGALRKTDQSDLSDSAVLDSSTGSSSVKEIKYSSLSPKLIAAKQVTLRSASICGSKQG